MTTPGVTPEEKAEVKPQTTASEAPGLSDDAAKLLKELMAEKKKRQALEAKEAEREAARQAAEQEAALKRGEHEKVIAQLKADMEAKAAKLAEYEARETARIEAMKTELDTMTAKMEPGAKALIEEAAGVGVEYQLKLARRLSDEKSRGVPGYRNSGPAMAGTVDDHIKDASKIKNTTDALIEIGRAQRKAKR